MASENVKILYIAGSGRSGSTILDNILGEVQGVFSAGEVSYIWERGVDENRLCGCGTRFRDCKLWQRVLKSDIDGIDKVVRRRLTPLYRGLGAYLLLPLILNPWKTMLPRSWPARVMATLERLYSSMGAATGAEVIVDSSKFPSYGYMLGRLSCAEVYVLHLVRDPCAVAYSLQRKKKQTDGGARTYLPRHNPARAALQWLVINRAAEAIRVKRPNRYLRVRYEDFMSEPRETVEQILAFLGKQSDLSPFVGPRTVKLGPNHTVSGNPNRLHSGRVDLRLDDMWQTQMRESSKAIVSALTWPLRRRYGYE